MDEKVLRITTPEGCVTFAKNCERLGRPDLAEQAREHAIKLRAKSYGAESEAEKEALEAVYAYEQVLSAKNGKNTRASRTWQMITRHGIIEAVERAVNRPTETQGYTSLIEMGLEEYAFEAVILRHRDLFSDEAVQISLERMNKWAAS